VGVGVMPYLFHATQFIGGDMILMRVASWACICTMVVFVWSCFLVSSLVILHNGFECGHLYLLLNVLIDFAFDCLYHGLLEHGNVNGVDCSCGEVCGYVDMTGSCTVTSSILC